MGLLDSVMGAVMGQVQNQVSTHGGMAGVLGSLLSNDGGHGGLQGLVEKFTQAGLGDQVQSWIGSGANQAVSPEQVQGALGSNVIGDFAAKLGIDPALASGALAQVLPGLVDQLTPKGQAPANGLGSGADLMGMLGTLLNKP